MIFSGLKSAISLQCDKMSASASMFATPSTIFTQLGQAISFTWMFELCFVISDLYAPEFTVPIVAKTPILLAPSPEINFAADCIIG